MGRTGAEARGRRTSRLQARTATRTNTIANHFDKICLVLESLGYLSEGAVTEHGRMLARIYAELDLVAAESVRAGVFDDLTPPQLAAVLAAFVYEARRNDDGERRPRMPDARTNDAMTEVRRIWREVSLIERDTRLERGVRAGHRLQRDRVRLGVRAFALGRAGQHRPDRR